MKRIAVIGIGQGLRGDDAVGPEAVRQWRETFPETAGRPGVRVETSELPGLALLDVMAEADAVLLVDAVQSSHLPGSIHRLRADELESFASDSRSAHGWGVAETIKLGAQLSDARPVMRMIGITAESFEMGAFMNTAVRDAIPRVCEAIEEEVLALLG